MKARAIAGDNPDADAAISALREAAAHHRVTLTAHDTAISRADVAAHRLDQFVESLRARGAMREFTKSYKAARLAARGRGEGFMSYAVAEARLRMALIPYLVSGCEVGAVPSLFAEIFRAKGRERAA
ncbi:hypothetical protein UP10_18755 [Bradyrhizobium sp. LTSPM299]|uniref:hypothetical protein n=1 Tax=Bradyrhizobium sp. LTSPM299 TaxID=1619233 RepID=UPI0005C97A6A|nr:hypothetical protein [Bradyrhizobium sp. LTSPM299]KJC59525.1 hypothetical protein UP10_18755 [Bradyrhizobium sp. LTSPM299]